MTLDSQGKPQNLISTDFGYRFRSVPPKLDFQVASNWRELEITWNSTQMSIICWYQLAVYIMTLYLAIYIYIYIYLEMW